MKLKRLSITMRAIPIRVTKSVNKKASSRKQGKGGRRKLPDHFPRIEVVHVLDEADCHCDHCQGQLIEMSHKSSEQLELIPMTVKVIKHIKTTYHCPNCNKGIKAVSLPPQPIPGSIASAADDCAYCGG